MILGGSQCVSKGPSINPLVDLLIDRLRTADSYWAAELKTPSGSLSPRKQIKLQMSRSPSNVRIRLDEESEEPDLSTQPMSPCHLTSQGDDTVSALANIDTTVE